MARRQNARAQGLSQAATGRTSADDIAVFVGTSLGELMNRKDALVEQLANVERQIAATRDRIKAAVRLPSSRKALRKAKSSTKAAAPAERKGNRKHKRPLPPDDPAAVKARTRVAQAEAKGRVSERLRTSMRTGNR